MKSLAMIAGMFLAMACSSSSAPPSQAGSNAKDAGATNQVTMTKITAGDNVFDARVAGPADGEVVFLLHGFPETSYEWRNVLVALADAGYRAIAPDQRGYSPGARPTAISDYAIDKLAQDVIDMADAVGAQRFHLVGHDWGAAVAWQVAGKYGDRVVSLSPVSVGHPDAVSKFRTDPTAAQYQASAYIDTFIKPETTDNLLANNNAGFRIFYNEFPQEDQNAYLDVLGHREAIDAALNWYRANFPDGRATAQTPLGPVSVPTLFTWSDRDGALTRDGVDLTQNFVTGPYRLEIIPGVSHWVVDLASDQLTPLWLDHLKAFPAKL
jgi:pimeloyl-ACP methyl ester carboxylesterase